MPNSKSCSTLNCTLIRRNKTHTNIAVERCQNRTFNNVTRQFSDLNQQFDKLYVFNSSLLERIGKLMEMETDVHLPI
jgi:hypothetical protein